MSEQWPPANIARVAREILEYLVQHPDAKDTLKGIAQWWRPANASAAGEDALNSALQFLVERGLVFRRRVGSTEIFGAAPRRKQELIALARALGKVQ